jgi:DNA polymerase III subunit epsilon
MTQEEMAAALEATGDYRVLRRLQERTGINERDGSPVRRGVFLDVETTGLDETKDEIIELAMVPFDYSLDGRIFDILPAFDKLREPAAPISAEITALTGINQAAVAGKTIDPAEVAEFIKPVGLVIAHNAKFDRQFCEGFCPAFAEKPWACTMDEIPWRDEGFEAQRLSQIAAEFGFFYDGHRAATDCLAGIEVLSRPLKRSGRIALSVLLESARQSRWRIWATNSPFERKDVLKARGYSWSDGTRGPKAWVVDVAYEAGEAELAFLRQEIYRYDVNLPFRELTARDRYSNRCLRPT